MVTELFMCERWERVTIREYFYNNHMSIWNVLVNLRKDLD